jgi:hypothetical protein
MAYYTVEGLRPPIITTGIAQTRHLHVYLDDASSEGSHSGTYSLIDPTGTVVSGASGITVTASATASFTPADVAPGSGYTEVWTLTVGGVARVWRIAAIVQDWTLGDDELLVAPIHILARYGGMTEYPPGVTSWLSICVAATGETLTDYARIVPLRGAQSTDRGLLMLAAVEKACERVFRAMARFGNAAAAAQADVHLAAYLDRIGTLHVPIDTDGNGAPDEVRRPTDTVGFPPPGPVG